MSAEGGKLKRGEIGVVWIMKLKKEKKKKLNGVTMLIYGVTKHRPDGSKKAFARLTKDVDALDIAATKLAIV